MIKVLALFVLCAPIRLVIYFQHIDFGDLGEDINFLNFSRFQKGCSSARAAAGKE